MNNHLKELEAESIYIIREALAESKNPVMLYSVGKDSSVMVRLAEKSFYPEKLPFPLLHIDTGYKFPEMYEFRDVFVKSINANLLVYKNEEYINKYNPSNVGPEKCCQQLKTNALKQSLSKYEFDIAFGGARREEGSSRAKERVFSFRDKFNQWDPKLQRPELWNIYNTEINLNESIRVFPLSNWTELDIWEYIRDEDIPIVPLYYAKKRNVINKNGIYLPIDYPSSLSNGNDKTTIQLNCRFRSLGCIPCTGVTPSNATTIHDIIEEIKVTKKSERESRVIDKGSGDGNGLEIRKKEGYF